MGWLDLFTINVFCVVLHDFESLRKTTSDLSVCMHDSVIISDSSMTVMQFDTGRSD